MELTIAVSTVSGEKFELGTAHDMITLGSLVRYAILTGFENIHIKGTADPIGTVDEVLNPHELVNFMLKV